MLINLSPITPPSVLASEGFDISLIGSCDDVVTYISDMIQIRQGECVPAETCHVMCTTNSKFQRCKYYRSSRFKDEEGIIGKNKEETSV